MVQVSSLSNLELGMKPAWDLSILVKTITISWISETEKERDREKERPEPETSNIEYQGMV